MNEREIIEQIQREWNEMKTFLQGQGQGEIKAFGSRLGDTDAKLDKMSKALDALELKLQRPAAGAGAGKDLKNPEKTKAFATYLRKGLEGGALSPDQIKLMVVNDDSLGGFGAPDEFDMSIIKGIVQISPVRELVRVRNTSQRSVKVMKRTGTFAAQWTAERGTRTETTGLTYGLEEIPTHELYALVDISVQDLEDTAFDLEGELSQEFSEQFGLAEGKGVLTGSAQGQPEGIMTNAAVAQDTTGDANNITYDGFVDVSHNIKLAYLSNARFILNLKTLGKSRKLVNGVGDPLWTPMASGAPATILGFPYTLVYDLDDVAANKFPVAFGDFRRGYQMVDRVNLQVVRDALTQATSGAVRFIARKRVGGQVVLAEAIRKLKVA
jgi:HK97 family phage major capsid protein